MTPTPPTPAQHAFVAMAQAWWRLAGPLYMVDRRVEAMHMVLHEHGIKHQVLCRPLRPLRRPDNPPPPHYAFLVDGVEFTIQGQTDITESVARFLDFNGNKGDQMDPPHPVPPDRLIAWRDVERDGFIHPQALAACRAIAKACVLQCTTPNASSKPSPRL